MNEQPNPERFSGSLIWWIEVPNHEQAYLQGVLEGYEGLGYYQTMEVQEDSSGARIALGRITSTESMRQEVSALLAALGRECGVRLVDRAPSAVPDTQPEAQRGAGGLS